MRGAPSNAGPGVQPGPGVLGALAGLEAPWALIRHADLAEPVRSAADVARQLALDPGAITKTLLVASRPAPSAFALVVLPVDARMDPDAVAGVLDWGQLALATRRELDVHTAQPVGGVSPLGSPLDVVVEETLLALPRVLVGAGRTGLEVEIGPGALVEVTGGRVAPVIGCGPPADPPGADPAHGG